MESDLLYIQDKQEYVSRAPYDSISAGVPDSHPTAPDFDYSGYTDQTEFYRALLNSPQNCRRQVQTTKASQLHARRTRGFRKIVKKIVKYKQVSQLTGTGTALVICGIVVICLL